MRTAAVYKITNKVTGESYIGSSVDIDNRITTHKLARDKTKLHEAIRKHGWDNFVHEILEKPDTTGMTKEAIRYLLTGFEQFWLDKERAAGGGQYNELTTAGRNFRG